jgi:DNA invertase Pin-like site-specific DNA recombinase
MKAVLYARVSSEKQAEKDLSIPAQLKALRKYAIKRGWDVVQEFVDEAESARTANRPAFQEMIASAKQKESPFEAILVWKLSRFARNREDAVLYKALLRKKGIQVLSINEQIDESPSGKLLEGMIEVIDEFYSTNLAQDTRRGMKENAQRGFFNGGAVAYGYKAVHIQVNGTEKRKLEINDLEAPMVRKVFKWCLEGEGAKEIVKRFNAESHKTRSGKPWGKPAVYYMLRNELYTGTLLWNRYNKTNGTPMVNPPGELIRIPNHHPALVSYAEFSQAQKLLEQRSPKLIHPRQVASEHLLSGLLFCVRCSSKMIAVTAKSGRFSYYACQKYLKQGKQVCRHKMLNTDKLELFFVNVLKERILTEEHLTKLVTMIAEELHTIRAESKGKLELVDKKLADVERRLSKLYRLVEDDKVSFDEISPRLRELTALRDEALAEKTTLEGRMEGSAIPDLSPAEARRYVQDLRETLEKGSLMERKGFIRSFVKRIDLDHPTAEIEYTVPMTPPKKKEPLRREVLSIGQNGSPSYTHSELG